LFPSKQSQHKGEAVLCWIMRKNRRLSGSADPVLTGLLYRRVAWQYNGFAWSFLECAETAGPVPGFTPGLLIVGNVYCNRTRAPSESSLRIMAQDVAPASSTP
ncbi:hypothetical protein LNK20_19995, partial [Bacillus safensis]|nr:hypothetical protein [Bacillus safensis]